MMGIYDAPKVALADLTVTLRLELAPFGIRVIGLKSESAHSEFWSNQEGGAKPELPEASLYDVAKREVDDVMSEGTIIPHAIDAHK